MCLICVEMTKENITAHEARTNLSEMYGDMTKDHVLEVLKLIWKQEDREYQEWLDGEEINN